MKFLKSLSVSVVIAAAGMMAAGCESPAGAGSGYDGAASAEASAAATGSAGGAAALSAAAFKTIKVKFEVLNGGSGLLFSEGIVSAQDDSYLVHDRASFSGDFTITIPVPASDEYLNVRWMCNNWGFNTYLSAKMKAESGTITLDYNGTGNVATRNLYDVDLFTPDSYGDGYLIREDWEDAKKRVGTTEPYRCRIIKVKFEVLNGGSGLIHSYGIVSTQDDSYLIYDGNSYSYDYTITIPVPPEDEYVNIRWKGTDIWYRDTFVKAKMKPESGTITLDYNGLFSGGYPKVATKNLYDVRMCGPSFYGDGYLIREDWEDAKKRVGK